MKHIFEHAGIMLAVDYSRDRDGIPEFNSVRVLDSQYRPVGPDLRPLLNDTLLTLEPACPEGGTAECTTFLSAIAEELM